MTIDADFLFPSTPPAETPPAATTPTEAAAPPRTDDEVARIMFDPEITYREQLRAPLARLAGDQGLDAATAQAYHKAAANFFADMELPPGAAQDWGELIVQHAGGADEATSSAWYGEAIDSARRRYGADADKRLADANTVLDRYPGFKQLLTTTRLGNHPRIVAHLVERAPALLGKLRAANT